MSAYKSFYLRSNVLKHVLGIQAFSMPAKPYLALYTNAPGAGDTGTEVTGGSYARKDISGSLGAENGYGAISSNAAITFSGMPSCTVTAWGIRDAATGGNLLYTGTFDLPVALNAGDSFPINSGDVQLSEA